MSKNLKEIVILHSNDIHGKFAGETDENGKLCHSLTKAGGLRTISEDAFGVLRDYLKEHKGLGGRVDKRIIILDE